MNKGIGVGNSILRELQRVLRIQLVFSLDWIARDLGLCHEDDLWVEAAQAARNRLAVNCSGVAYPRRPIPQDWQSSN